jgi:membrane protein YqaA with SNARE-associated domain
MGEIALLSGLFGSALLAATLLPASSEAALAGLVALDRFDPLVLIGVASAGNILGASINWALGRFAGDSRFIAGNPRIEPAGAWFRRYGKWSLLFSWVPLIGDPLTLAAGLARLSLPAFLVPVAVGKVGRYLLVYWLADSLA